MNMKVGIALALLIATGAGYGAYNYLNNQSAVPPAQAADATKAETADAKEAKADKAAEPANNQEDPVVAKVDGTEIRRSEVTRFLQTSLPPQLKQYPTEALFPLAVEQLVSGAIVDAKAKAANTADSPEVAERLAAAKADIIRAVFAEKAIDAKFSEDQVKKAYDEMVKEMPKVEEVHARHILVEKEDVAKDIIKKLDGGAKFEDLAKEFSKDQSNAASGGDLGYFAKGDMVQEFSDAAFALKKGEYTKSPVKTQFGYHVVQTMDKRTRPAPKYDDVKGQLDQKVRRDILNKLVEDWRKGAKVEMFDMNGKPLPEKAEKK